MRRTKRALARQRKGKIGKRERDFESPFTRILEKKFFEFGKNICLDMVNISKLVRLGKYYGHTHADKQTRDFEFGLPWRTPKHPFSSAGQINFDHTHVFCGRFTFTKRAAPSVLIYLVTAHFNIVSFPSLLPPLWPVYFMVRFFSNGFAFTPSASMSWFDGRFLAPSAPKVCCRCLPQGSPTYFECANSTSLVHASAFLG